VEPRGSTISSRDPAARSRASASSSADSDGVDGLHARQVERDGGCAGGLESHQAALHRDGGPWVEVALYREHPCGRTLARRQGQCHHTGTW
jgi:hypothetical protein